MQNEKSSECDMSVKTTKSGFIQHRFFSKCSSVL